jgi:hypothetical protein
MLGLDLEAWRPDLFSPVSIVAIGGEQEGKDSLRAIAGVDAGFVGLGRGGGLDKVFWGQYGDPSLRTG